MRTAPPYALPSTGSRPTCRPSPSAHAATALGTAPAAANRPALRARPAPRRLPARAQTAGRQSNSHRRTSAVSAAWTKPLPTTPHDFTLGARTTMRKAPQAAQTHEAPSTNGCRTPAGVPPHSDLPRPDSVSRSDSPLTRRRGRDRHDGPEDLSTYRRRTALPQEGRGPLNKIGKRVDHVPRLRHSHLI